MMMSGKDFLKSHVLSWRRKVYFDWEDVTSSAGQGILGLRASNWEMVDRLTGGTRRRFMPVERSDRLPGRLRITT